LIFDSLICSDWLKLAPSKAIQQTDKMIFRMVWV
jgi:hypothetical protein